MRKWGKLLSVVMVASMLTVGMTGCGKDKNENTTIATEGNAAEGNATDGDATAEKTIREYSLFVATAGKEVPDDNRMYQQITEKIGAKAKVTWLTGQTDKERVGVMIAGGEYPDMIVGSNATPDLVAAGALVDLTDKLDNYPNLKKFRTDEEWNMIKGANDGSIYYIPIFGKSNGDSMYVKHNDEAFWIQKRVLEWANWPEINTLDQYFDLIQGYLAANPKDAEGQENIGYEILCDDWRWFCLENPSQFLAGYANDGAAIVDADTKTAHNYDDIPEAKAYFTKLNEMYNAGVIDPETFTMSYDQYIAKLSSGRVLGMVDQGWQFNDAVTSLVSQGKDDCTYVPLDLTIEEGVATKYFTPAALNVGDGIAITTSCKDVDGALQFLNDLLDPEVITMRGWGEEGVDYMVDEDGMYYRTEEQRENAKDSDWVNENLASTIYSYLPNYSSGLLFDGKNAVNPAEQPSEFREGLSEYDKKVLDAYGYTKWTDFLTYTDDVGPWFPIYSAKNTWESSSDAAIAFQKMEEVKREWLPKVIMASTDKVEDTWNKYMDKYHNDTNYKVFEDALSEAVAERIAIAEGNN